MNPNYTTVITPLKPELVEACRRYLRENAEPRLVNNRLQCQPLFRFDRIANLHFCSFVVLDADADFAPSLVFEATFDGSAADFFDELLEVATKGVHEVYRHCADYTPSGLAAPELMKEYLMRHDVGANTFFCGSPGRSVAQVRGENLVRNGIVSFLANSQSPGAPIPARSSGVLEAVRRHVQDGSDRWAGQQAPVSWEIKQRPLIVALAIVAGIVVVCGLGLVIGWLVGWGPFVLHSYILQSFEHVSRWGASVSNAVLSWAPWIANFFTIEPAILHILIALSAIWLLVRIFELFLTGWTKNPHDQLFINRFPLQIAVIVRYALVLFIVGSVLLAVISGWTAAKPLVGPGFAASLSATALIVGKLIIVGLILVVLKHWATSLKLAVQLRPYDSVRENIRRLLLDLNGFAVAIVSALGLLLIVRIMPFEISEQIAAIARSFVYAGFVAIAYGLIGLLIFYALGLVAFGIIRLLEIRDERRYSDPAELMARAGTNARKYAREEGGINRYQNHLASITTVKQGFIRRWLLRLALFVINLLSRFWFNRGELGGIPTILSARWVMVDGGRRLLFLDNFGGAWESYLNEFIDMAAVKGLNAIWSNTFVSADRKNYRFPATKFLFWKGAQAEQPFKAYVRQSQVETIVWYGAYPTLSVVNINDNTSLRQSLFKPMSYGEIDSTFQNL